MRSLNFHQCPTHSQNVVGWLSHCRVRHSYPRDASHNTSQYVYDVHQRSLQCVSLGKSIQLVNIFSALTLCLPANSSSSWIQTSNGWDLTRSQLLGSTPDTVRTIPVNGKNSPIIIDTKRTALVIIDMQSEYIIFDH